MPTDSVPVAVPVAGAARYTRLLPMALVAALIATLCDANHVHTGTLSYPEVAFFGQPWWTFPGFVVAFLVMGVVYLAMVARLPDTLPTHESTSPGSVPAFAETAIAFAFVYLASGFGNAEPVLLSVIFYGSFLLRWLATYERGWLLLLAIIMAIGGMFAEGVLSAVGGVAYRHVDIFHVPWWLGGLYMHGAFALREGMRYFVYRG